MTYYELPTFEQCIQAGIKLWKSEPTFNARRDEARWGGRGGKKIYKGRNGPVWTDHTGETPGKPNKTGGTSGGALKLLELAGMLPERKPNGRSARAEYQRTHDFSDEHGKLLFQECKLWQPFNGNWWTQRRPDGNGGWIKNIQGVRRVLFRLRELLAADPRAIVFICEGPKDVDAIRAMGFVATCNPGGAGKWLAEYNEFFRGRTCVILPDCDKAGVRHERIVRESLSPVAQVFTVRLPGLVFDDETNKDVSNWIEHGGTREELAELVREARGETPSWLSQCQHSDAAKDPKPIPNVLNAYTALTLDPHYRRFIKKDLMRYEPLWHGRYVTDPDITVIQKHLQRSGLKRIAKDVVNDAVELYAHENGFHPLRNQLNALRWDGTPRVDTWTTVYLGTVSDPYTAKIGRLFLIAMMARLYNPGCKCEYMVVLEGPQGELKSTTCRVLAGGSQYFSDGLPDVSAKDKDVRIHLRGKWLIEISELHAFSKAESTELKSFLSRQVEEYRPPFGRREVKEPRQCVFIGTSNKDTYLKDETGGRRFWPLKCGTIRLDSLKRDREQLLAEALHLYKAGQPYWPEREFEKEFITPEQDARFDVDAWAEPIAAHLKGQTETTVFRVATEGLGIERGRLSKSDQMRISQTLQSLGCKKEHGRDGNIWKIPGGLV